MAKRKDEHPDALGAAANDSLSEIFDRVYQVTSADGLVQVSADGQPSLRTVNVANLDELLIDDSFTLTLTDSATAAVSQCVGTARSQTARAMAQLPGMDPQLRALLLGGL